MTQIPADELWLFSDELIERHPQITMDVLGITAKFCIPLGWHYIYDLVWTLSKLDLSRSNVLLDAGGCNGIISRILALYGQKVVNVDAMLVTPTNTPKKLIPYTKSGNSTAVKNAFTKHVGRENQKEEKERPLRARPSAGQIEYHCSDLEDLKALDTDEFDAVVSISAVEHNPPEKVLAIMTELKRVAKPGAPMAITISVDDPPRYDEPSASWLLNEKEVVEAYGIHQGYTTNFSRFVEIFDKLKKSERLNRWLAYSYFNSGKNGMPWGDWNPTYLPAGVLLHNRK